MLKEFAVGTATTMALLASPSVALAEDPFVCGGASPSNLPSVRGFTWSGTVAGLGPGPTIVFLVDHVYADAGGAGEVGPTGPFEAGATLTLGNTDCNPITGLVVGNGYLVSTRAIGTAGPTTNGTVIWQIRGSRLAFHHMYMAENHLPAELVEAHTLPEALALVAPGAEIPPTDTLAAPTGRSPGSSFWLVVIGTLTLVLFLARPSLLRRLD